MKFHLANVLKHASRQLLLSFLFDGKRRWDFTFLMHTYTLETQYWLYFDRFQHSQLLGRRYIARCSCNFSFVEVLNRLIDILERRASMHVPRTYMKCQSLLLFFFGCSAHTHSQGLTVTLHPLKEKRGEEKCLDRYFRHLFSFLPLTRQLLNPLPVCHVLSLSLSTSCSGFLENSFYRLCRLNSKACLFSDICSLMM